MRTWVLYDTWRFVKRLGRMREKFSRVKLFGKWVDASIAAAAPRTPFADAAAYASNFLKVNFNGRVDWVESFWFVQGRYWH